MEGSNSNVQNIHYGDVLIKYGSIVDVESDDIPSIVKGKESKGTPYLRDGDVIIADTAEDEAVGKCCEIININGAKVESGLHTIPCRPLAPFVPMYLGYYMNSQYYHKQLFPLMQGVKVLSISKSNIGKTHLSAPSSHFEQKKIVKMLHLIDMRISKQQRIIEVLKKYKRGAIKSLFTNEITLAVNATKWENHKLSDLITLQSGQDFAPSDFNEHGDGIPYMTGASCIVDGKTAVSRWTTMPRCFAYYGDTLLVCKGSGSGAVVMLSQDKVHIARQFMALRPHEGMTKGFCFYLTLHLSEKMKQSATGLIEGIDRKTVLNQDVRLPSIMEQEQIVNFLSAIEKTLLAHEHILKSLVSTKRGLMQQLFI